MRAFILKAGRTLLRRISTSVEIDGLWVAATNGDHLSKVEAALQLIKDFDRRRYARLTKDLERVWVTLLLGPLGQFDHSDWTCELDPRFVAEASSEQIASTIVHEATHARLWRRGVRYEEDIRHRVEAICFRQEQLFAKRLAASDDIGEKLGNCLDFPKEYWSDKSFRQHHIRGAAAALRYSGIPNWLIGAFLRIYRARRRRERRAKAAMRE